MTHFSMGLGGNQRVQGREVHRGLLNKHLCSVFIFLSLSPHLAIVRIRVPGWRVLWHGPGSLFLYSLVIPFLESFPPLNQVLVFLPAKLYIALVICKWSILSGSCHLVLEPMVCASALSHTPLFVRFSHQQLYAIQLQCLTQAPCALCRFYSDIGIWPGRSSRQGLSLGFGRTSLLLRAVQKPNNTE